MIWEQVLAYKSIRAQIIFLVHENQHYRLTTNGLRLDGKMYERQNKFIVKHNTRGHRDLRSTNYFELGRF